MKYSFLLVGILVAGLFYAKVSTAQSQEDTLVKYYSRLSTSARTEDKVLLENQLYQLLKSNKEVNWTTAQHFFYELKKQGVADSIMKVGSIRFPEGIWARDNEAKKVYDTKVPSEKEKLYIEWIKRFDPQKFGTDRITYDYVRANLATAFAKEGNVKSALKYVNQLETEVWHGEGNAMVAGALLAGGFTKEAAELYKVAVDNSILYKTIKKNEPGAGFAIAGLPSYATSYANILYGQKKYEEAYQSIKNAYESAPKIRGGINALYAKILVALSRNEEAFAKIDEAVKLGQATKEMKDDLKSLYAKVKGSDVGYETYLEGLNKILIDKFMQDLPKKMIKTPITAFVLKDLDGNLVSSTALKGKIVILDLWATWCGPCKKSFPAMQMAVNKFRNDPDVKFLFIHTWEHDEADTAIAQARKYIADNKYDFHVLMDLKDSKTGNNKVVESLKVAAIPTKFVIDRNGDIRFRLTGFEGGDDAAVEELSAMISLAKKGS